MPAINEPAGSRHTLIREFLAWCRQEGFYRFTIRGIAYPLASAQDESAIHDAIYAGSPSSILASERQALRHLPNIKTACIPREEALRQRIETMTPDDIRLLCGEMTAQEMRTAQAVLNWVVRELKK